MLRVALVVGAVLLAGAAKVAWNAMEARGWVRTPTAGAAMRAFVILGALLLSPEIVWLSRQGIVAQDVAEDESPGGGEGASGNEPPTEGRHSFAGRILRWFLRR